MENFVCAWLLIGIRVNKPDYRLHKQLQDKLNKIIIRAINQLHHKPGV